MVMAWAVGKVRLTEMLWAWAIIYCGNFIGAIGTALLVYLTGQAFGGNGAVAGSRDQTGLRQGQPALRPCLFSRHPAQRARLPGCMTRDPAPTAVDRYQHRQL